MNINPVGGNPLPASSAAQAGSAAQAPSNTQNLAAPNAQAQSASSTVSTSQTTRTNSTSSFTIGSEHVGSDLRTVLADLFKELGALALAQFINELLKDLFEKDKEKSMDSSTYLALLASLAQEGQNSDRASFFSSTQTESHSNLTIQNVSTAYGNTAESPQSSSTPSSSVGQAPRIDTSA